VQATLVSGFVGPGEVEIGPAFRTKPLKKKPGAPHLSLP